MRKKPFFNGPDAPNTFIGGVGASSVTSANALAGKLSLSRWHIKNFQIDSNNNVSCYINRNYSINSMAFFNDNNIRYYIDEGSNCTRLNTSAFHNVNNLSFGRVLIFPNVTSTNSRAVSGGGAGTRSKVELMCTPRLTPIGSSGTTSDNTYSWADFFGKVYVDSSNETINGGSPDPDIASAISSAIASNIVYITNTNPPTGATGMYTISATTTSIDLGWGAVTHTNTIDYILYSLMGYIKVNQVQHRLI